VLRRATAATAVLDRDVARAGFAEVDGAPVVDVGISVSSIGCRAAGRAVRWVLSTNAMSPSAITAIAPRTKAAQA
jgi:hypothetical protein